MRKKLTHNWGLKIISVLFAIVLWLIVVNIVDPVETKTFNNVHVTVENESVIKDQGKVYDITDNSDTISVSVKGRRSALEALKSTDLVAIADMKEMIVKDSVPIDVTASKYNDKIQDISPKTRTLKISIEDSATKQFAINTIISGTPGDGYAVGDITCNPSVLKVTGAASVVNKISKVAITVDVEDMTTTINASYTPKFYDSDGDVIESTSLEYKSDDIAVTVDLLKTKEIELNFLTKGTPGDDYQCVGLVCSPDKITVAGEDEDLADLNELDINNDLIDISDATDNVQQIIDITGYLPSAVRLVDSSEASVLVTAIMEKLETKSIEVAKSSIALQNIPSKYSVNYANNDNIVVTIKGLAEVLNDITAGNITASLDLSGLKETGTKVVTVAVSLTDGIEASVVGEVTVNIVVTKSATNASGAKS
ncbi:YbbR domain-containing protein [Lachnotalea glycerini]|uniref:YbbR domain-containing protein n=1 Tax=Lachnotalea glycerini TaxID=1763509 RepID=A0A318ELN2_9FIRM|nr:CdaR family protein [Lachnotalea glycerini]PXV90167.1 YbbR domain-containing protein [Lachnotalea glycerini]